MPLKLHHFTDIKFLLHFFLSERHIVYVQVTTVEAQNPTTDVKQKVFITHSAFSLGTVKFYSPLSVIYSVAIDGLGVMPTYIDTETKSNKNHQFSECTFIFLTVTRAADFL